MILGFLGKGGSGKSSVATQMTLFLREQGKSVLAIDADHNMDLSFNLTNGEIPKDLHYLGSSLDELQTVADLKPEEKYTEAFLRGPIARFSFEKNKIDSFTNKYSYQISGIRLMAAGPQTDQVLYGESCSHILTTPLKIYLPLLELEDNEDVIVDEKAGADGVTTGIVTGIDVAVIVCEPAVHSIKTAKQIVDLLKFYETPYVIIANKVMSPSDKQFIEEGLGRPADLYLNQSDDIRRNPSVLADSWIGELKVLYQKSAKLNCNDRLARTTKKFERNTTYCGTP